MRRGLMVELGHLTPEDIVGALFPERELLGLGDK